MLDIGDQVIEYIIEEYTSEPGVRKLKELMFEIVGEINLATLKNAVPAADLPLVITCDDIKQKYLKDRRELNPQKIHTLPLVGVINGLWANSLGKGGVLPIEAAFYPASAYLEMKLTGMQGEVMKESMTVAKSVAWTLFTQHSLVPASLVSASLVSASLVSATIEKTQGLHIHVPEGATPKDGPSAGTAITMVIYSLLTGRRIKNDVAITGEICLQGRVTAIGGLDLKILGGIKAGVKTFIYPRANQTDWLDYVEKYGSQAGVTFIAVDTIEEVIPLVFNISNI
jgi:ATP-dependent Lon protease